MESAPNVSKWLDGKNVFITGASGFIGKVLLEKLLRCCPNVNHIYILLRQRRGKTSEERLQSLLAVPLFETVKKINKECLSKVRVVNGDLSLPRGGISISDWKKLQETVSVIFHVAATVRVDQLLSEVVKLNTCGTRDMMELAKGMKKLEVFVHVSTAYSNVDSNGGLIKEQVVEHSTSWKEVIDMVNNKEEKQLDAETDILKANLPNTYLLSKRLAEQIVYDFRYEVPSIIYRPSMVSSTVKEPFIGWVDNMASLTGISAGVAKGVVRVHCGPTNVQYDFVPADVCVNGMIIAAWKKANFQKDIANLCPVYNSTSEKADIDELMTVARPLWSSHPMSGILWEPYFISCTNKIIYQILFFVCHMIPGVLIDTILTIGGQKPRLVKTYKLLYRSLENVEPMMFKNFKFETQNFESLKTDTLPEDRKTYWLGKVENRIQYIIDNYHGIRMYVFREPEEIPRSSYIHRKRMFWLDRTARIIVLGLIFWFISIIFLEYLI